jgi:uncharacterized protein
VQIKYWPLLACWLLAGPVLANDAPASDESIRELLAVTDAHKLIDTVRGQVDAMVKASSQQALQGKPLTPEKQAILDRMRTKMEAVIDDMLSWDSLQALYLRTYRASFTQSELDGILKFYKTPAGQAMIKKMPVVMQNVMGEMQGLLQPMQQRMQEIQRETSQELKDLSAKEAAAKDAPTNSPPANTLPSN